MSRFEIYNEITDEQTEQLKDYLKDIDDKLQVVFNVGKKVLLNQMNEKFNTICQMVLNDNTDISLSVSVDEKLKDDDIKIELNK